jgi:hypothetical protein
MITHRNAVELAGVETLVSLFSENLPEWVSAA